MVVSAADPAALRAGVSVGQTIAQAQAMVSNLHIEDDDSVATAKAQQALAVWCQFLSPLTAPEGTDGVWIDTSGCDHLHDGELPMAMVLADRLRELGYHAHIGLADATGAAHALAHFSPDARSGPVIAAPQRHIALIDPLPVEALRVDTTTAASLHRLGLHDIAAVRKVPRAPLVRRFGAAAMMRLDQAIGMQVEPIRPVVATDALQHREAFVEPIGTEGAIGEVITKLVEALVPQLRQRGAGVRQLDLYCEKVDGTQQTVRVGTSTPVDAAPPLIRLLRDRIDTIEPGFGIEAMRLVVSHEEALRDGQSGTASVLEARQADLSGFIDHIINRYGAQCTTRLSEVRSHIPERTQKRIASEGAVPDGEAWSLCPWPRPARLFDQPVGVRMISLLPDLAPEAFYWNRHQHLVARADGPERVYGEWWLTDEDYGAVRDYWQVDTIEGDRFWLFRKGDGEHAWSGNGDWFLHGIF